MAVFGSPVLLLALVIAIATPKPSNVTTSITVTAPHGGIFDKSCNLTEAARGIGATDAEVVDYGATPGSGSKSALIYKLVDGKCVAKTNLSLFAGNNYEVYVAGKLAGEVTPDEIKAGSASKTLALQVSHKISGQIVLSTHYSGCQSVVDGTGCTAPLSVPVRVNVKFNFCYGQSELADIAQVGSPIRFYGLGSRVTATAKLGKGIPVIEDKKTGRATCTYEYTIPEVLYDESGYKVLVGSKKHQAELVSVKKLEDSNWKYDFEFKR